MGLNDGSATLVAPRPKGIIDPATGKPVGANDPMFGEINKELADKGFLVTSSEALLYGILLLQKKIRRTGTIER